MTAIPVPDELAQRLARRARRKGLPATVLVERAIYGFLDQNPYKFFETGSFDLLRGDRVDKRLHQTGSGEARS